MWVRRSKTSLIIPSSDKNQKKDIENSIGRLGRESRRKCKYKLT